jgi:TP901 family phage tail tape measure protein
MAKQVTSQEIYENNIFSNLKKDTQEQIDLMDKLDGKVIEFSKHLKESVKGLKFDNSKDFQTLSNAMESSNKMTKESIALEKEMANLRKVNAQATLAETKAQEAQAKATNRQTRETEKLNSAYKQESARLNELRNRYKDLEIRKANGVKLTKEEIAESRKLQKEITSLNAKLTKVDASAGQNWRTIGKYKEAVSGLRNALLQLGVSFGVFQVLRGGISTISDFQSSLAELSAITGVSGDDLDKLGNKSIELSKKYGTSASNINEALKLAGSARPELLKNSEALAEFTEKALILSKASGDDVQTSISNLAGTLNAFEEPATKAGKTMDILANASQLGTQEIPYLTDAFTKFGGVAKANNVSIAESASLVEELGKKFPEASMAGTGLRNVMLKLSATKALPPEALSYFKQYGISLEAVEDKTKPFSERLQLLKPLLKDNAALVKIFGTENYLAAQTLIQGSERIGEFTEQLDKNGTAQDQANIKSKTLAEAGGRLKANFEALFLEFRNGSGALTTVVDFLARNLGTVVSVLTKLGALYLVFIARQKILNSELTKGFKGVGSFKDGLKGMVTNLKEGASAGTGLGGALKGIGWTALIGLAVEFATELYNIASGAKLAEVRMQEFEKASQLGMEKGRERAEKFSKALKKEMQAIDLMNISDEKKNKLRQKAIEQNKEAIKQKIIQLQQAYKEAEAQRKIAYEEEKRLEKNQISGMAGSPQKFAQQLALTQLRVTKLQEAKIAYSKAITELRGELEGLGDQTHNLVVEQNDMVKSTNENIKSDRKQAKATQEKKKALKEYNDELTASEQLLEESILNRGLENATEGVNDAIEQQLKNVEQTGTFNLQMIYDQIEAEDNLQKKIIERTYLQDLANAKNQADIDLAEFKKQIALEDLENETLKQKKEVLEDLNVAQENYKGNVEDTGKAEEDALKKKQELAQMERDLAKMLADYLIEQSNRTIDQLDKQIASAEKNIDYLDGLAQSGQINAQQSRALELEQIRKANLEKQKEAQKQRIIQITESVFDTYNTKLNNPETSKNAVGETIKDVGILQAFINSLPKFFHGTEDTGTKGFLSDQFGAITGVTHSNERVVNAKDNSHLKGISNERLVDIVKLHNQMGSDGFKKIDGFDVAGKSMDLAPMLKELEEVKKAIQNQPTTDYNFDKIVRGVAILMKEEKRGNTRIITKNRFS